MVVHKEKRHQLVVHKEKRHQLVVHKEKRYLSEVQVQNKGRCFQGYSVPNEFQNGQGTKIPLSVF